MTVLIDKGADMLAELPTYYRDDRFTQGFVDVVSRELQRVEDMLTRLASSVPSKATGTELAIWEATLDLPVEPEGLSVEARQALASVSYRKRNSAKGTDWVANVTQAIGSQWSYAEDAPADYEVTVRVPGGTTTRSGTTTDTSAVVTGLSQTSDLFVGQAVQAAAGVPTGATILSVDSSSQVSLSVAATASGARTLTFVGSALSGYQVVKLLRDITPAHLAIVITTGAGFGVDTGLVDIETL